MGNKRRFDEIEVLTQISEHFWQHGYAATKVDDLSEITGLTKTSLYNAFGNKEALFTNAINFYVKIFLRSSLEKFDLKKSLTKNLEALFKTYFYEKDNRNLSYGCLVTNSILELSGSEPKLHKEVNALFAKIRQRIHPLFLSYVKADRIKPGFRADELTDFFMTFLQGLRVQSRGHSPKHVLRRSIRTFLTLVQSIEIDTK